MIEVIQSESIKAGVRMGYSRSKIVDADNHDRVIAFTEGQGVKIGIPPEGLDKMPEDKFHRDVAALRVALARRFQLTA